MSAFPVPPERRYRRSHQPLTALTYQLEHIFEKEKLCNFTLGDSNGLIVASAGNPVESEVLAAYAPMLAKSVARRFRRQVLSRVESMMPGITPESVHVRQITVDGQPLYLTLAGRPGIYRDVGLYRAITGVRRILAQQP